MTDTDQQKAERADRLRWAAAVIELRTWGHPLNENESKQLDEQTRRLALEIRDGHRNHG